MARVWRIWKEVVCPSSMQSKEPAAVVSSRGILGNARAVREAFGEYAATWKSIENVPPVLKSDEGGTTTGNTSTSDDLRAMASTGAEGLKPALQNLYKTNMATFQEVSKQFLLGYQNGLSKRPESH